MNIVNFKKILNAINKQNIAIIGHMGSGKSIFGKKIANHFNINHIDTDKEISKFENATINEIFLTKGEKYFRKIESDIVLQIINKENIVISLGGGSILSEKIRNKLKKLSYCIFLDVDINILSKRLKKSKNRPLLKDGDILTKMKQYDLIRRKYYLKADLTIANSDSIEKTFFNFNKIFSSLNV